MIEDVKCPDCGGPMTRRTSQHGKFWGCKAYPRCRGTLNASGEPRRRANGDVTDERDCAPSDRWRNNDRSRWR